MIFLARFIDEAVILLEPAGGGVKPDFGSGAPPLVLISTAAPHSI